MVFSNIKANFNFFVAFDCLNQAGLESYVGRCHVMDNSTSLPVMLRSDNINLRYTLTQWTHGIFISVSGPLMIGLEHGRVQDACNNICFLSTVSMSVLPPPPLPTKKCTNFFVTLSLLLLLRSGYRIHHTVCQVLTRMKSSKYSHTIFPPKF